VVAGGLVEHRAQLDRAAEHVTVRAQAGPLARPDVLDAMPGDDLHGLAVAERDLRAPGDREPAGLDRDAAAPAREAPAQPAGRRLPDRPPRHRHARHAHRRRDDHDVRPEGAGPAPRLQRPAAAHQRHAVRRQGQGGPAGSGTTPRKRVEHAGYAPSPGVD
jgi:hypothetical protein